MKRILAALVLMGAVPAQAADQPATVSSYSKSCLIPIIITTVGPQARFPGSLILNSDGTWSATSIETVQEISKNFPVSLEAVLARKALADVAAGHPLNLNPDCNMSLDAAP